MSVITQSVLMRGEIVGDYDLLSLLSNHNGSEVWVCSSRIDSSLHILKRFSLEHPRLPAYRILYAKLRNLDSPFLNLPEESLESSAFGFCVLYPFYETGTLKSFLKRNGPLSLGQCVHLLKCLLTALALLHKEKIIHRDVKPGNIYLSTSGDASLGDFGIAKIPEIHEKKKHFAGSAAYVSPEQAIDSTSVKFASDLFSLGSVMYEVVTGKQRYSGAGFSDIFSKVISDHSDPPSEELLQYIPDSLVYLLCCMMCYSTNERASDAAKLLEDLNALNLPECPVSVTAQNG